MRSIAAKERPVAKDKNGDRQPMTSLHSNSRVKESGLSASSPMPLPHHRNLAKGSLPSRVLLSRVHSSAAVVEVEALKLALAKGDHHTVAVEVVAKASR
mmetsp:Transcript_20534/g.54271  ORF Transcript_20534/g.54271 Transcript_20534/m.54271 type:complete len:99 (-) Transcript_20534:207-503(-)